MLGGALQIEGGDWGGFECAILLFRLYNKPEAVSTKQVWWLDGPRKRYNGVHITDCWQNFGLRVCLTQYRVGRRLLGIFWTNCGKNLVLPQATTSRRVATLRTHSFQFRVDARRGCHLLLEIHIHMPWRGRGHWRSNGWSQGPRLDPHIDLFLYLRRPYELFSLDESFPSRKRESRGKNSQ